MNNIITINRPITENDVNKLNVISKKNPNLIVELKNTKGQNKEIIQKLNPNIKVSIIGGLNYHKKKKFDSYTYIERTMYTPNEVYQIINQFEKLERGINASWTNTEKALYIYKTLAESMHYSDSNESQYKNGRDIVRTLNSIVSRNAVCSGFALIYKEAMDRQGIPCLYQNQESLHSWNVLELDGKVYAIDLTWDCNRAHRKQNVVCDYKHFGLEPDFYKHPRHSLKDEQEETEYPLSTFSIQELTKLVTRISTPRVQKCKVNTIQNINRENVNYVSVETTKPNIYAHLYEINGKINICFSSTNNIRPERLVRNNILVNENNILPNYKIYQRVDGSNFCVIKNEKRPNTYKYCEFHTIGNERIFRCVDIISENNLIHPQNTDQERKIANYLLSPERLKRRVNYFNGYCGYIRGAEMIYDREYEQNKLNIINRK